VEVAPPVSRGQPAPGPASLARRLQPRDGGSEGTIDMDVPGVAGLTAGGGWAGAYAPASGARVPRGGVGPFLQTPLVLQSLLLPAAGFGRATTSEPDIDALLAFIEGDGMAVSPAAPASGAGGKPGSGVASAAKVAGAAAGGAVAVTSTLAVASAKPVLPMDVAPLQLRRDRSGTVQSVQSNLSGSSDGYDEDTGTPTSTPVAGQRHLRGARIEISAHGEAGPDAGVVGKTKSQKRRDRARARKGRHDSGGDEAGVALPVGRLATIASSPPAAHSTHGTTTAAAAAASASTGSSRSSSKLHSSGGGTHASSGAHTTGSVSASDPRDLWSTAEGTTTSGTSPPLRAVGAGGKPPAPLPWPRHLTAPLSLGGVAAGTGAGHHRRPGQRAAATAGMAGTGRPDNSPAPPELSLPRAALSPEAGADTPAATGGAMPPAARGRASRAASSATASPLLGGAGRGTGVANIKQQLLSGTLTLDSNAVEALFAEDAFEDSDGSDVDHEVEAFKRRLGFAPAAVTAQGAVAAP
jgi:hypothetical protein